MFERFKPRRPERVAVLAYDGVVLGDLATPCEIFGRARLTSGASAYTLRVCSARRRVSTGHLTLSTPWPLSALAWADTIIVPGAESPLDPIAEGVPGALRQAIARGKRVASICTGAFVLARTGALDGLRVTTHWRLADELQRRHPSLRVDPNVLYIDNGQLLTSAGAAAGLDLCLHIVRRDFGEVVAARTARDAVMPLERSGGQAQFIDHVPPVHDGSSLAPLLGWLERHLDQPLSLEIIARRVALSTRSLSRHFRHQVGTTPAAWVAQARVRRARALLESSVTSIERVASLVGFESATVLRQHFARVVGTTPTAYRLAFARRSRPGKQPGPVSR
jgi:transcriptional regulator GlxA family with amidase domain